MLLEHEIDCEKCCNKFKSWSTQNATLLRAAKLAEIAQQEGDRKEFINESLESLPNYNKQCNCNIGSEGLQNPIIYDQDLGNNKHRDVCLRCGGILPCSGTLSKCPKCNSDDISAGNWNVENDGASRTVNCQNCDCRWIETFANARWELE